MEWLRHILTGQPSYSYNSTWWRKRILRRQAQRQHERFQYFLREGVCPPE